MFKIALDAGHGLKTSGKRCSKKVDPNQTSEWWLNNRIAVKMAEKLKAYEGYELLRVDDTTGAKDISLSKRCTAANNFKADIYFSVHHNAGINGGSGGGITAYVWKKANAELLGWQKIFYNNLIAETGLKGNRATPIAKSNFYVLVNTNMQAVLVEHGFMDSTKDTPIILTDKFADQCATANVKSLVEIGGLKKKATVKPEPSKEPEKVVTSTIKEGDIVTLASDARYYSGKFVPAWVKDDKWVVKYVEGDRAVIDENAAGTNSICSPINVKYLTVVKQENTFKEYKVKVTAKCLYIRKGAGTNYGKNGSITGNGIYTIVAEASGKGSTKGWGKLKSGKGWISLDYCKKV